MLKCDLEFTWQHMPTSSTHQTKLVIALLCQISQERELEHQVGSSLVSKVSGEEE
jgi:hypothetical protein